MAVTGIMHQKIFCTPGIIVLVCFQLTSRVVSCETAQVTVTQNGKKNKVQCHEIVLEDTVLFPEGGGQVCFSLSLPLSAFLSLSLSVSVSLNTHGVCVCLREILYITFLRVTMFHTYGTVYISFAVFLWERLIHL